MLVACVVLTLQHDITGTLAEVESRPRVVEGAARLVVEDHQGVEAVEMEAGEGFRTAADHYVGVAGAQHVGTEENRVGGRRTGCGQRGVVGEQSEVLCHVLCACATIVMEQAGMGFAGVSHLGEVRLGDVHAAHRGTRDEHYTAAGNSVVGAVCLLSDSCVGECFLHGHHAEECCPAHLLLCRDVEGPLHLVVAHLHLADR